MRLDPAVTLIMTLFALMLGATSVSAFWGYTLGRQALSGITQPDIRRTNQSDVESASHSDAPQARRVLKSEDDILAQVTAKMQGNVGNEAWPDFQFGQVDVVSKDFYEQRLETDIFTMVAKNFMVYNIA